MFCATGHVVFTRILASSQSYLLNYINGDMESLNPQFALYGSNNECARTDTSFLPLTEVITRAVTLGAFTSPNAQAFVFLKMYWPNIADLNLLILLSNKKLFWKYNPNSKLCSASAADGCVCSTHAFQTSGEHKINKPPIGDINYIFACL